ncbi:MAG TPA: hypothetical protein VLJ39_15665 [Tepidisphaeraceae bacterium]|nr:hypothetical protein [Tepidisphaeraceae bacterium]
MSSPTESSVRHYLNEFDRLAAELPKQRRQTLRDEIQAHLRDAIPADATSAEIGATLADFGTPAEIITQELEAHPTLSRPDKLRRRILTGVLVGIAVLAVALTWMFIAPTVLVFH